MPINECISYPIHFNAQVVRYWLHVRQVRIIGKSWSVLFRHIMRKKPIIYDMKQFYASLKRVFADAYFCKQEFEKEAS
ncbi:hypothetical protein [Lysinibacillus parviboronicapiens]|uniref:hypothetical protein n=1 Tax=Lysinibacillus parviboronicapiens TaxID=436516 RepID=UPI0006D1CCBF|nr:hypothetical protein [Lysinibacillus parviboronicapiens]